MTWVLILFVFRNGAISQEFHTEEACRKALAGMQNTTISGSLGRGDCFPKGEEPK